MARTILPSGEELLVTPEEVLRYMNPDGLRQLLRQERLTWHLKANRDVDYYDNSLLYKYAGELHNEGNYQRMEIRTYPDNGAFAGYAGIHIDSGVYGLEHKLEEWDEAMSDNSKVAIVNRASFGAMATIPGKLGYGLDNNDHMSSSTENRIAMFLCDPYDGRVYLYSNDENVYVNNEARVEADRIPDRTVARIIDIPTRVTQLINDMDFISDPDYHHTDNNFSNSNRYVVDNLDDRTFVYPEIAKDSNGDYIKNQRMGLNGEYSYAESDGSVSMNTQPDLGYDPNVNPQGDRENASVSSYNENRNNNGIEHAAGFLPGVFKSLDELKKVDLIGQRQLPLTQTAAPGSRRPINYYSMDGNWASNWFDREHYPDSYLAQPLNPANMEVATDEQQPVPYSNMSQDSPVFDRSELYQWRYNRVDIKYPVSGITINIVEQGSGYKEGDLLRWSFGDDSFVYRVLTVGSTGNIQSGEFVPDTNNVYDQDPSTHGIGIEFTSSGVGHGAKLAIRARAQVVNYASQIKNNLYAYVDITPTVRSDNTSRWSDNSIKGSQNGRIGLRSTAAGPAYSGINSGKGGPNSNPSTSESVLYEHGGNATAGAHVHLFRYVINTQNPTWRIVDGVQVFTGEWVDQGPMGVERPADIKALLFSNSDTNNFNNYYKFNFDILMDMMNRNGDGVETNNANALMMPLWHFDQRDPEEDRIFTMEIVNPETSQLETIDVTDRVFYVNVATGVIFKHSSSYHSDPTYGYGYRAPGWFSFAGTVSP